METCERLLAAGPQPVQRRGAVVREMERRLLGEVNTQVRIGRYRVERLIGSGAQGLVYSGWDPLLSRAVAIKVWIALTTEAARESVLREARAMAAVTHPNVVGIFDVGVADPDDAHPFSDERVAFVVMELFGRGALRTRTDTRPPRDDVFATLEDTAHGLDAIARAGLVHRDVKPSNLLRSVDGHVAVGDFGLVVPTQTCCGTASTPASGTPMYMAPEQLCGRAATPRTDQYALALIAFELLTGDFPFVLAAPQRMLADREVVRLHPGLHSLRAHEQSVLRRALDPEPGNRYPSCAAFVRALREASAWRLLRRSVLTLALSAVALSVVPGVVRSQASDAGSSVVETNSSLPTLVTMEDVTSAIESGSASRARRLTRRALSGGQEDVVSVAIERIVAASLDSGETEEAADFLESIYFEAVEQRMNRAALCSSTALAQLLVEAYGALEPARWWLEHAHGHLFLRGSPATKLRYEAAAAWLATASGDQPQARTHMQAAFEACQREDPVTPCDAAGLHRLHASILEREGKIEDAVVALQRGLALADDLGPVRRARLESYLGDLLRQLGRSAEALQLHRGSVRRLLETGQHPRSVADARVNLGLTQLELGQVRDGTAELKLAAEFYEEHFRDSSILAEIRANLGAGYALSGDAMKARIELEAARITLSEVYLAGHPRLHQLALLRAQLMNHLGEHADALAQSMSVVDAQTPAENPGVHAVALLEAGRASSELGRDSGAVLLKRAVQELEQLPAYSAHLLDAQQLLDPERAWSRDPGAQASVH